ncbi:hypothetical protein Tco_0752638 [Tanacetum coccineum]|uniref:Uncharacterized protein n=1 Tax=Tanacetum coccineum TaxID=301880 RepID=A0ABQ4ZAS2_9ASTR
MENEHELGYETFTRVYLGSYEHYKSVGAEVEHSKPGFELQGAKMVETGRLRFLNFFNDPRIIREQRIAAYNGYEIREWGMRMNEGLWVLFIEGSFLRPGIEDSWSRVFDHDGLFSVNRLSKLIDYAFLSDCFQEEGFALTMRRCRMDVAKRIVKRRKLITELEMAGDIGYFMDHLDCLRDNQMIDLEKLRLVNRLVIDSKVAVGQKDEYAFHVD